MSDYASTVSLLLERLAPPERIAIEPERIRQASVVLLLRDHLGEAEILMIERATHPGDHWSGHLALPGGRVEPSDANLLETAIRETHEEVGLDLRLGPGFIGQLSTVKTEFPRLPRLEIEPLVALSPHPQELRLSDEVAAAFWLPVALLRVDGRSTSYRLISAEVEHSWPAYSSERGPIWGITERILTEFLTFLR